MAHFKPYYYYWPILFNGVIFNHSSDKNYQAHRIYTLPENIEIFIELLLCLKVQVQWVLRKSARQYSETGQRKVEALGCCEMV